MRPTRERPELIGLLLAAIVALGAAVRALDLPHPSLTYDELSDFVQSVRFCGDGDWTGPASDGFLNGQLPSFVACAVYRWLPPDPGVPRAISVACGALTIWASFLLASRFVSRRWALLTALLVATSTFDIASSRLGFSHGHRFYVPFLILGLHLVLDEERRGRSYLLAGLALGVAVGCDLLAGFGAVSALAWVVYSNRGAPRAVLRYAALFAAGSLAGVLVSSPMYFFHPVEALVGVHEQLGRWDGLRGYLWLGEVRETLPWHYYAVVLASKVNPVVLALACVGVALTLRRPTARAVFLCACLWPIAYFSVKQWKNPFYVVSFVPLLCVLATIAVRALFTWKGRAPAVVAAAVAVAADAWTAWKVHPDYLMGGIQWSEALYGEFQGPAVSHGQWIGEALEFIERDARGTDPMVLMFRDAGEPQTAFYASRVGLTHVDVSAWGDGASRAWLLPRARYVVLGQDALRLFSPLHPQTVALNAELASVVRPPSPFRLVKAFGPAAFPMVWVYRRE